MSECRVRTSLLLCGSHCTGGLDCFQLRTIVNKDAGGIPRQVSSGAGSRMGEMPGVSA